MSLTNPAARDAAEILLDGQTPRVWSLIVTLFGDLAQGTGDKLSGAVLTRLGEAVQVRPEAMRVALHRLRRDGWIESQRNGRLSHYALSAAGRAQSAAASPRIYATGERGATVWHLLLAGEEVGARALEDLAVEGTYVPIGSMALLGPGPCPQVPPEVLRTELAPPDLPVWLRATLCPAELAQASEALLGRMQSAETALRAAPRLCALDCAAMRLLIVHGWRRLLLRVPDLPDAAFPEIWRGPECRRTVTRLLARLPRPELAALEAEAGVSP